MTLSCMAAFSKSGFRRIAFFIAKHMDHTTHPSTILNIDRPSTMNMSRPIKPRCDRIFRFNRAALLKAAEKKCKEDLEEEIAASSEESSEAGHLVEKSAEIMH